MKYFVTGGTGFVGGRIVHQLLADGHDVIALARTLEDESAWDLATAGADVVEGDITRRETLVDPMRGVDGVFHVAGWYDVGADDPSIAERINVEGTRNVLETMRDLRIEKGVYTSSLAVNSNTNGRVVDESYRYDGEHLTAYDRTKWEAHYEVAQPLVADGLPLVTVMPGVVYGPGDTSVFGDTLRDYLRGDLPVVPRGVAYSPGHVEDVARAHVLAMEHGTPGEEYIVGGDPATLVEMFDVVAEVTGRDPPRDVHPAVFGALASLAGVLENVVDLPKDYRAERLRVLAGVTYLGDNAKAKQELGLQHRSLREGLTETVEHELAALAGTVESPRTPETAPGP